MSTNEPTETFVRTAELEVGDGRTLDARIAPYNTPATVADPPHYTPYQEVFLPGAFERQLSAADRVKVWLNFEHEQGLRGLVGHGVELRDRSDGLHGSFRVHENSDGEKALTLVREGLLTGMSLEFRSHSSRRVDGVVQRLRASIDKVSLCRFPAYEDAQVLAVREQTVEDEPPPAPPAPDDEDDGLLGRKLEVLGVTSVRLTGINRGPWDPDRERFDEQQLERSALLCRDGERLMLVLEPDGRLNLEALERATSELQSARLPRDEKAEAARKARRYYTLAGLEEPRPLLVLARA